MKLSEIIALSKAGVKAAEIRKMIADDETEGQPEGPAPDADDPGTGSAPDDEPDDSSEETDTDDQEDVQPEPDYKALYLEEKKKREKAQEKNTRTEQPEKVDDDAVILNLVNEFL